MGENVPNPCEQDPWKLARKRFCEDLSAEEKSVFKSASLENVLDDANTAQHEHQRRSKTRAGARRLYPFVEKLNAYGKAMDVYVNASPTILSLLWGSVRVLLKVNLHLLWPLCLPFVTLRASLCELVPCTPNLMFGASQCRRLVRRIHGSSNLD